MARTSRHDVHQGRVTLPDDDPPPLRPRSKAVTITAWTVVAGLVLAVAMPVLLIILG